MRDEGSWSGTDNVLGVTYEDITERGCQIEGPPAEARWYQSEYSLIMSMKLLISYYRHKGTVRIMS